MDSVEKLERLSGAKVFDLHRHNIVHITVPSTRGPEFGVLRRIDDEETLLLVLLFVPYLWLQLINFRFYTLMVLSIALLGTPAFRNLICSGLVLAEDGKKMSKRLKSYPSPMKSLMTTGLSKMSFSHGIMHIGSLFRMQKDLSMKKSSNVLDQWINSATQSLVHFVRQEMDAYRLYMAVLCEENFRGVSNMSFKISLARPALVFKENAIVALYAD
ncbi:putative isoleucine--tRNA ligase, cytoplasmic [Gossypium australe]|uniref:Putative isoleucine--tRNA ligase, cytoplasmic n=1 Tax=Gossypium australe TaxID=47621 RepID=A0A5B6UAG3_9ROSI|nr:putative isoleucine--tRNA ligase, cytoplasmic [Gossypium australe]